MSIIIIDKDRHMHTSAQKCLLKSERVREKSLREGFYPSRRLSMPKTVLIPGASRTRRRGRGGAAERLPDQLFHRHSDAVDTEVTKSYGEVGQIPDAMFKSFMSRFEGKDAPNPHDVAEAVARLVGQSKGSRAARTVVGAAFGSDKANEAVAPVQAKVVEALGLSHLEKIA
jgi:hypothetical protein